MGARINQPSPLPGTGGVWTQWAGLREGKVSPLPHSHHGGGALRMLPLPPASSGLGRKPLCRAGLRNVQVESRPPQSQTEGIAWEDGVPLGGRSPSSIDTVSGSGKPGGLLLWPWSRGWREAAGWLPGCQSSRGNADAHFGVGGTQLYRKLRGEARRASSARTSGSLSGAGGTVPTAVPLWSCLPSLHSPPLREHFCLAGRLLPPAWPALHPSPARHCGVLRGPGPWQLGSHNGRYWQTELRPSFER